MAFKPSESPSVLVKEIDLSGVVPAVTSSTGAMVGDFNWGPCNQPILIGNEKELVKNFGAPNVNNGASITDFMSASYFLKYSASTYVTRAISATASSGDRNAVARLVIDSDGSPVDWTGVSVDSASPRMVINRDDFDTQVDNLDKNLFVAKYPGVIGNSLKVSICPADSVDSNWSTWAYKSSFDAAPGTSSYVSSRSADSAVAYDEAHVVVIDEDGVFTGVSGSVLETFAYVSLATDAKTVDGSANHIIDVLNNRSSYIWATNVDSAVGVTTTTAANWTQQSGTVATYSFSNGANATTRSLANYQVAADQYEDENTIQVDLLVTPQFSSSSDQEAMAEYLEAISTSRKDCIAITSPHRSGIVGITDTNQIVTNVTAFANALTSSSYLVVDNNYLKVYDKYNDQYVWIPAASSTAGIMAATDDVSAPWFSPAGSRRGAYLGVSSLAFNATKTQRDTLYKANINPIVSLPGQGIILYGDKTHLGRPSAFDRINVRRLFLVMERAIKAAAQNVLFEFNDEFTRAEFVNIVEPFLREIKGRRGITDFRVVCDETNNTADIIDNNSFVASVFVKPARSINYVTLNFVAVRTGVDFEEVVGIV